MKPATLLLVVLAAFECRAQPTVAPSQAGAPAFEVASERLGTEESLRYDGARMQAAHGSLTTHSLPLRACIPWAYQMPAAQVIGPDWLNNVRLDIVAKAAAPVSDQQLFLMLRTLLASRLGVKTHLDRKEMPVYVMTVGKGGPKFSESTSEGPHNVEHGREVEIHQRMSMYELFAEASNAVGRPIAMPPA
jgi:uncharacterized protein (TIGR03435 family)